MFYNRGCQTCALSQAEISNDISENQHGLLGVHMVDLRMFADEIKEVFVINTHLLECLLTLYLKTTFSLFF
jgi:hypothetical protein